MAQLIQINVSQGGVPKHPIHEAYISVNGVEGDQQKHTKFHGGPDKAVCMYSLEHIMTLQREGHSIWPGAVGENLTISGLNWSLMVPYSQISIGEKALLEITEYAVPCNQIKHWFNDQKSTRISQDHYPNWARVYCRVLVEGTVRPGDRVQIRV